MYGATLSRLRSSSTGNPQLWRICNARTGLNGLPFYEELRMARHALGRRARRDIGSSFKRFASSQAALRTHAAEAQGTTSSPVKSGEGATSYLPYVKMNERKVHVHWDASQSSKFGYFWLRDHCRCPECFHQITMQRLVDTFEIPEGIEPASVEAIPEGLRVAWRSSEPHTSIYNWDWLRRNSYDPRLPVQKEALSLKPREKVLWGAKIEQDPPTVEHSYVMNEDRGLWKVLKKIDTFGFCFITGVEATPEATESLTWRIGNIRRTQYGEFWDFTSDLAKGDTAYTTLALGAHTDTTYFTDPCGLQLFHLLQHTDGHGGATLLVDGFYVASLLRELHTDAFHTLTSVRVPTHAAGELDSFFRPTPSSGYPILNLDPTTGELMHVRYNNDDRSVMNGLGPEELLKWYEALRLWNKTLRSPDSEYWVQLTPGTVVVIDNHRVLHGRSSFDGKRRMCGAYIGMDDFRSKLTVLTEKFASTDGSSAQTRPQRSIWSPLF